MSVLYLDHFGLSTDPFRITPDTGLFFTGGQRGDILEGLVVASMHDEGIVSVVGEIGMGKTMLSRMLLERLRPLPADTVYLANPVFDRDEILSAIARDLMPEPPQGGRGVVLAALESVLIERYSQGRRVVVVIDEAHSMPGATLEEIRLLSNLETTQNKLLKIVLFGQPELDELLEAPQLRQVKDRISHRFELQPLNAAEASAYLAFRLHKAGWRGGDLFDAGAHKLLAQASEGRTRKLNMLADKSMLAAYAEGVEQIGVEQVRRATGDSLPKARREALSASRSSAPRSASYWRKFAPVAVGALAAAGVGYGLGYGSGPARNGQVTASAAGSGPQTSGGKAQPPAPAASPAPADNPPALPSVILAPPASAQPVPSLPASLPPAATFLASNPGQSGNLSVSGLAAKLRADSLAVRMQATNQFIAESSASGFTVQLLSQRAPRQAEVMAVAQEVQAALDGAALKASGSRSDVPVLVHDRLYQQQLHHAIYVGHFESRPAALQFIDSSPSAIKRYKPVVRRLDVIRKEPAP